MSFTNQYVENAGAFVPSTQAWDVASIYDIDVNSADFKELLVRLYQNINAVALVLNQKVSGYHINRQFLNSEIYTNSNISNTAMLNPGYTSFYFTGALNAGVTTVPHFLNVQSGWQWVHIAGAANLAGTGYPIPYAAAANVYISVTVTPTNIVINNQSGVNFTSSNITLKYITH